MQLQGTRLNAAEVNTTDFSNAFLWRTQWWRIDPQQLGAVRLEHAAWKPIREGRSFLDPPIEWTGKAYAELRDSMKSIPEGKMREEALKRIETLDCTNPDKTLASCDPAAKPPSEVLDWQKKLAQASVDDAAYARALATELQSLVCANDDNAIHILRGIIRGQPWLGGTDREAPALVDFIMSKNCPVSAALTDDDKAKLLKIKLEAEQKFGPPPASKKEK